MEVALEAPQNCLVLFSVCLVEILNEGNTWYAKYLQNPENFKLELSKKKDCTPHNLLIEVITQGIGGYLPLIIVECILNCRGGSTYVNWAIDSFDLFMVKYNIIHREEILEHAEWRFNGQILDKSLFFQRTNMDKVIFLEPHCFEEIMDENNMVNITLWGKYLFWQALFKF